MEVVHSEGGLRLLSGVGRTDAARMVHSWLASLDIVAVVAAVVAVGVDIASLDRSSPADIRLAFHNIVMDSTSCTSRYLFVFFLATLNQISTFLLSGKTFDAQLFFFLPPEKKSHFCCQN